MGVRNIRVSPTLKYPILKSLILKTATYDIDCLPLDLRLLKIDYDNGDIVIFNTGLADFTLATPCVSVLEAYAKQCSAAEIQQTVEIY